MSRAASNGRDCQVGIEAITHGANGSVILPSSDDDWRDWVSATATRNYVLNDPVLDWLNLYGEQHGFQRDDELEGYDPRTDFSQFIMNKGIAFEAAVVEHLKTLAQVHAVAVGLEGSRDVEAAEATFETMRRGEPIIYQAVLRDAETRTYGTADLLIRSDELYRLFPDAIAAEAASIPASDLGGEPWHYCVVDIKFTTLGLLVDGQLANGGSAPSYKVQLFTYNRALGRLQGFEPPVSYVLGRGWQQTRKGEKFRGTNCMELLAPVPQTGTLAQKRPIADVVDTACHWLRKVRAEGANWQVLPQPSVSELYPNMGNDQDGPWHSAKKQIAEELRELTLLWQVSLAGRQQAHAAGIFRWTDSGCRPEAVGVTGETVRPRLRAILDVNQSKAGPAVRPIRVHSAEAEWRAEPSIEFYVDFETVGDLDDDFSLIPEKGGQPLIFMIGCGHLEDGQWQWSCFIANALTEAREAEIIDGWFAHMDAVKQRLDPDGDETRALHWSHAERSTLETAFNSAKNRHPEKDWGTPRWFDLLKRVIGEEPVVVRGAFGFGLKAIAKAMHAHGHITTDWQAGPTDGMGAMVGAWSCAAEAAERGRTLPETELMQEIAKYNEVDCKVMMEIVRYLRGHH